MADPLFGPEVRMMLQEENQEGLKSFCEALHPATIAESLADEMEVPDIWRVLRNTNVEHQADIFEYFPLEWQVRLVDGAGRQEMARLIEEMSSDDRADLLRRLDPQIGANLLRLVDEADRKDIAALVKHEEDTAGAVMTTEYAWLPADITAKVALERLRLQAPNKETIYYINIVDEHRKLLGIISLRDLIMISPDAILKDHMETQIISTNVEEDREKVASEMARYDLLAIPVTDEQGRLVGIVTHDDIMDVVVSEATEDLQRQGAVEPITEDYLTASFVKIWRQRAIWLAFLFVAGMLTFNVMAHFDGAMRGVPVLAMFVPLLISCGGNSGSQAAVLVTRALALGQAQLKEWHRVLRHELMMGLALGFTLGFLAILRTYFLTPDAVLTSEQGKTEILDLTLVISLAVACICIWGTLVGSMLPMVFKRFGIDPAIASSPFVATFVDVTGIFIYFSIARIVLPGLA